MKLSSPAFDDNALIPKQYSRLGGDVSPPLEIGDVPNGAASLALVCHDPDAPYAHGWTHWVVWNIPPTVTNVSEGTVPFGSVQGVTDWGEAHWGGPQPPSGTHRYVFYLYALDTKIDLQATAKRSELEQAISGHIIETATTTGVFSA